MHLVFRLLDHGHTANLFVLYSCFEFEGKALILETSVDFQALPLLKA